jgi:quinol monooxygenase YgiN
VIHVVAIITAKPGMRQGILREFRANMPAVHAEKGCIEYGPAVDTPDFGKVQTQFGPDTFVVIEKWESADALKAHAAAPHMAAYAAKTKDMIANRVIHVLTPA